VRDILNEQQGRSRRLLEENKLLVQTLRDLLLEKKVLDKEALANILPPTAKKDAVAGESDINLRLKAKSLNIPAEDFETGKIKDVDSLYSGKTLIEGN